MRRAPLPRLPGLDGRQSQTVAPQADTGALDRLHTKADETRAAVENVSSATAAPKVDASGFDTAIAKAQQLLSLVREIGGAGAAANSAIGGIRARANANSFSDGVTSGAGP